MSLLVEAGAARYAIDATHVLEVSPPDASGETLHGNLHLKDLSALLGGPPEARPGTAVVLDTSPTLAVRVKKVLEVSDLADKPRHPLPRRLVRRLEPAVRGVLEVNGALFFELDVETAARGLDADPPELLEGGVVPMAPEPDRALVFESQGARLAVPLGSVSQVVPAGSRLCALPHEGPLKGLVLHQQHLWPAFSVPGMAGGSSEVEPLVVLVEVEGEGLGLLASHAFGVHPRGALQGAQVLDLPRLFS
ncbi:MAG: defective in fruiting DifE [Archangiaceae bacterium]|nr:defective in fruiting DifE [Archangiaceae bacterium]